MSSVSGIILAPIPENDLFVQVCKEGKCINSRLMSGFGCRFRDSVSVTDNRTIIANLLCPLIKIRCREYGKDRAQYGMKIRKYGAVPYCVPYRKYSPTVLRITASLDTECLDVLVSVLDPRKAPPPAPVDPLP